MNQTETHQISEALALIANGRETAKILATSPQNLTTLARNSRLTRFSVNGKFVGYSLAEVRALAAKRHGGQS